MPVPPFIPNNAPADPFTQVWTALRNCFLNNSGIAKLVRIGNFMNAADGQFQVFKQQVSPGDLPEMVLLQRHFILKPFGQNSTISEFEQEYVLIMTQDTIRLVPINQLKLMITAALLNLGPALGLSGLVRQYTVEGGIDKPIGDKDWSRGSTDMVSVMSIHVSIYMGRQQLAALYPQNPPTLPAANP
jgi:hypothetical protein